MSRVSFTITEYEEALEVKTVWNMTVVPPNDIEQDIACRKQFSIEHAEQGRNIVHLRARCSALRAKIL